MIFSTDLLKQILPDAVFAGIRDDEEFDLINIAHLKQFETLTPRKILYFVVYEDNPGLDGWYDQKFDRSLNILEYSRDLHIVFVVDDRVSDDQMFGSRHIRVRNIFAAIDHIRQYMLYSMCPKVIGVTGSVGKTTCVALIQSMVEKKFSCARAYSKRLTPLTLSSWLANFLKPEHQVLALEYSMYRKHHISVLANMLTPDIGVFLNVKPMHLGVGGINTLEDVLQAKRPLVELPLVAVVNADDPFVSRLQRKSDLTFSLSKGSADAVVSTVTKYPTLCLNHIGQSISFVPYVRTTLFYQQVCAAALVATQLGISPTMIGEALNDFVPAEHRIQT